MPGGGEVDSMNCGKAWCKHFDIFSKNQCSKGNNGENTEDCFEFQTSQQAVEEQIKEDEGEVEKK